MTGVAEFNARLQDQCHYYHYFILFLDLMASWQVLPTASYLGQVVPRRGCAALPSARSADLATTRRGHVAVRCCQHPVQVMWSNILGPQQEDHRMVPSAWVHVCSRQLSSAVMNWDILRPVSSIESIQRSWAEDSNALLGALVPQHTTNQHVRSSHHPHHRSWIFMNYT